MLKTKAFRLTAFILCVAVMCISDKAQAADEDLYLEALQEKIVSNTRTAVVEKGDFTVTNTAQGRLTTRDTTIVRNTIDVGTVEFVTYSQLYGTYVNAGDRLAELKVIKDEVAVNEMATRIEREEENLKTYIEDSEDLIKEYDRIRKQSPDGREKELAALAYDKLTLSYTTEKQQREENIEELKEQYKKYAEVNETEYITASCGGIIGDYYDYRTRDVLAPGSYIATIYDLSTVMVYIEGNSDKLRYNMPVTITQSRGSDTVTLEGRVISCRNAVMTNDLKSPVAYILIEGDPMELSVTHDVTVLYQSKCMENTLMVPKNAIYKDNNGTYVITLAEGKNCKRYVTCGGENLEKTWIVNGLNEGDTVILK